MWTAGIVCATPHEYQYLRDNFRPHTEKTLKGRSVSIWRDTSVSVVLIHGGPGKIQAASATQLVIDEFEPDIVIDAGAAGSLDPSLEIGTIVCNQYCYEHDIFPIEQFSRWARELTTSTLAACSPGLVEELLSTLVRRLTNQGVPVVVRLGNAVCGEQDIGHAEERERLRSAFNAHICNWETSAVLKTCAFSGVGSLSFRVVSDRADKDYQQEYKRSLPVVLPLLGQFLKAFATEGAAKGLRA